MTVADLDTSIAFPLVPFRAGAPDFDGFRKNVRYVVRNVHLDGGRRRVIASGGGSLLHHLTPGEQLDLARVACEEAGASALFISGVIPSPLFQAVSLVRAQMRWPRPPDAFLLLPVAGIANPEGVRRELEGLCRELEEARFLLYLRDSALRGAYCRLVRETGNIAGIKVGTSVDDVAAVVREVGGAGAVIWGVGDRSTAAVRAGARGHTSGICTLALRAGDEINNAQRRGDYSTAEAIEAEIHDLEEIRFIDGRAWNYAAMVEALRLAAFDDVEPSDGGPFNAAVPPEIAEKLKNIAARLKPWH